ncbi:HAD family hydrolase [Promicromonospora sp. NPDC057138]|uniref:HAD family hydrolase n=1 Tax=Promicromonospora sp. NPDC057138 TaxID=3346031 RepID=UPI0036258D31
MSRPAPRLVALDIEGTLLQTGITVPEVTAAAVAAVRKAGHHVALATGRPLIGALPVAHSLGLNGAWIVGSGGGITAYASPSVPGGYRVRAARTFDVDPVAHLARMRMPRVRMAVELAGWGWRVNQEFDPGHLEGQQHVVAHLEELWATPATRMVLCAPGIGSLVEPLRQLGVTPSALGLGWVDITPRGPSTASALETLRGHLAVPPERTVAIGDSWSDAGMLQWAAYPVAMGQAPTAVKALAKHVTGPVGRHGAADALRALLDADASQPATVQA